MKWCCAVFQGWYATAGERGLAVLVERRAGGNASFVLQFRAMDMTKEVELPSDMSLSLCSDVHIKYCPWCGTQLESWYSRWVDELYRPGFKVIVPGLGEDSP